MTMELKTNEVLAAATKTQCLLHFGVCGNLFQRVGTALWNDTVPVYFSFPVDIVVQFHAHVCMWRRGS